MKKKLVISTLVFCFLIILTFAGPGTDKVQIQASTWSGFGPYGGNISGLDSNPQNAKELFAATASNPGQIFKSTDAAGSWTRFVVLPETISDLKIAPTNPNIIYVLGASSVRKSTNKGSTWTRYSLPSNCYGIGGRLAVHPTSSSILYVAGYRVYDTVNKKSSMAVFKSTNGGQTWSSKTLSPAGTNYGFATCLSLCGLNPNIIYVGGYYSSGSGDQYRIYKTIDGGINYANKTGIINALPQAVNSHPADINKAFASTAWGIYRTLNGGDTWTKNNGIAYASALAVDKLNANIVYGGYNQEIYKSTNGGADWTKYGGLLGSCSRLLVNSSTVYFGSSAGVFKSTSSGASWASASGGMKASEIPALAVAPSSPNNIYVAAKNIGFYRSSDSGASLVSTPSFDGSEALFRILVNQSNASDLYVLASGGGTDLIYRSFDNGNSWAPLLGDYCEDIAVSKLNFGKIFAAGQKAVSGNYYLALHVSTNGGSSWSHLKISTTAGSCGYAVAVQPSNDNVIYVGGQKSGKGVLYKSTNGGSTWSPITGSITGIVRAIAVDPTGISRIYVGTESGLYKSENGGSTWALKANSGIRCLKVNPITSSNVYAGGVNGVLISSDYGNKWTSYDEGFIVKDIYFLDIDASHRILYAATNGGGACKRTY